MRRSGIKSLLLLLFYYPSISEIASDQWTVFFCFLLGIFCVNKYLYFQTMRSQNHESKYQRRSKVLQRRVSSKLNRRSHNILIYPIQRQRSIHQSIAQSRCQLWLNRRKDRLINCHTMIINTLVFPSTVTVWEMILQKPMRPNHPIFQLNRKQTHKLHSRQTNIRSKVCWSQHRHQNRYQIYCPAHFHTVSNRIMACNNHRPYVSCNIQFRAHQLWPLFRHQQLFIDQFHDQLHDHFHNHIQAYLLPLRCQ